MFPKDVNIIETVEKESSSNMGKSFLFDFAIEDFTIADGKVIHCVGIDAVIGWIDKVLRTEKFKFKIYETETDNEYGIMLLDFVNNGFSLDFVKTEIEREIKEALAKNKAIAGVHTFRLERVGRGLNCTFTVNTIYGTTTKEVIL